MPATIATFPGSHGAGQRLAETARRVAAEEQERLAEAVRLASDRERDRIRTILRSSAARGRRPLAERLALDMTIAANLALSILEASAPSSQDDD